jgi:hypothetical protein
VVSPPGTYINSCRGNDGNVNVTVNYDVTTRALVNRGNPPACLLVVNTDSSPTIVRLTDPANAIDLTGLPGAIDRSAITVPTGTTRVTAAQLAAQGFTSADQISGIGVAC